MNDFTLAERALVDHLLKQMLEQNRVVSKIFGHGILSRLINNRIKVIKRIDYGYRDSQFFFMKIKNHFPGNSRSPP